MYDPLDSISPGMGNAAPTGNAAANPYGKASPTSAHDNALASAPMGGTDSAEGDIGYKPETGGQIERYSPQVGRADRLGANIYTIGPQMNSRGGGVI